MEFFAHSTDSTDKSNWQTLGEHLTGVAKLAEDFASAFDADAWGDSSGRLHDAGKATSEFVKRLEGGVKFDHSTFGARLAQTNTGKLGLLLPYIIAGHHGGLFVSAWPVERPSLPGVD